jgi:hypothetical protein
VKISGAGTGWLGREGSNLRMAESKSAALPLGYAPIAPEKPSPRPYQPGSSLLRMILPENRFPLFGIMRARGP